MSRSDAVTPDRQTLLKEAAGWLMRLDAGELSQSERQSLQSWYQTSAEHRRVWRAACELNRHFFSVPGEFAKPVLGRRRVSRRGLLKSAAGAGLLLPVGWALTQRTSWQSWSADYRTAIGERRSLTLSDGSELTLNTETALDVVFDDRQRGVRLYRGEAFLRTNKESARPFITTTAQGGIRAQDAEFAVRCLPQATAVTVTRGSIVVSPRAGPSPQRIEQGKQCHFTAQAIASVSEIPANALAWRNGELVVDNWPLATFVAELGRYRPGILRCDSAVAALKVSGVFQLDNTGQALEVLEQVFDLRINRFTDYWVSIGPADA